jgi:hypothetical protein
MHSLGKSEVGDVKMNLSSLAQFQVDQLMKMKSLY